MSRKFRITGSSLLFGAVMFAYFSIAHPAPAEETLRIGGTGSALGSMRLIGAAFEKSHPGIRAHVLPSVGSSGAVKAVVKGVLDVGLISRPLKDEEVKLGLSVIEYARTPFILVTRKNIPVSGSSTGDIVKIYKGEMQTWPNGEHPGMLRALTDQDSVELLEQTPGAVGFSTLTQVIAEKRHLKVLSFNGVFPSTKALVAKVYPLSKTLFMVVKPEPSAAARRYIDFARSAKGRKILEETGNVPVSQDGGR